MKLYQKLHEIQKSVTALKKNARGHGYEYLNGEKLLDHLRPLMDEKGLLLKQEVLSIDNERMDYVTSTGKTKGEILSKVMMRFTWIDSETGEKDENLFGANGQNDWDKGVGSALTYAERYFLLKFFHIATDHDDVDNPDLKKGKQAPAKESLTPTHAKWGGAVKALAEGAVQMPSIEARYFLSPENRSLLIDAAAEMEASNA